MLSKCANPVCSAPFLYLHEGKLFRMEVEAHRGGDSASMSWNEVRKPPRRLEFFWLCDSCARRLTLEYRQGRGIRVVPLARAHAAS